MTPASRSRSKSLGFFGKKVEEGFIYNEHETRRDDSPHEEPLD
jgi:hypothetical protein